MSQRLIVVNTDPAKADTIITMAEQAETLDCHVYSLSEDRSRQVVHLLVDGDHRQAVLDRLQSILGPSNDWRITILPVEASIPLKEELREDQPSGPKKPAGETREEIYNDVVSSAQLNSNFIVFVVLSTVVCAIGLIEDNVAVVIGAMVIAPLLGPNLAFGLGVALGNRALMARATATNAVGVALTVGLCAVIGMILPPHLGSQELMARTDVGFDGIALALASGAAAALSLTTGLPAALVGVMVAVALMPPAATIGLMAGSDHWELARGAFLLLAINIVCVNLATQITFLARGVTPRTWFEKRSARAGVVTYAGFWLVLLVLLAGLLVWRGEVEP